MNSGNKSKDNLIEGKAAIEAEVKKTFGKPITATVKKEKSFKISVEDFNE